MYQVIKNFHTQFEFEPKIENAGSLGKYEKYVVIGVGGSNLVTGLVSMWKPEIDMVIHRSYGLPFLSAQVWQKTLVVASSYSGNTEEPLDGFAEAGKRNLARAVISTGGGLLKSAIEEKVSYIKIPDTGIQPRSAAGFIFLALLKLMGKEKEVTEVRDLRLRLNPQDYEKAGQELAKKIKGFVPLIYASLANEALARNWKVRFNETGKIPAFYNVFPELNHNEMIGLDVQDSTRPLSQNFLVIILKDEEDDSRIKTRMQVLADLYRKRGLPVKFLDISGKNKLLKIFSSLVLADWTAYYTAQEYGVEAEQVPMVEEFKKLIV